MRSLKKMKRDNDGIALISVLIVVMLCFLLSATIMRVSYLSLLSKSVATASTNNFYGAEGVVDEMRLRLQTASAAALNVAGKEDQSAFIITLYNTITAGAESVQTNVCNYLSKDLNMPGAEVQVLGDVEKTSDTLVIHSVHVKYVDPKTEYVSEITTDLVIKAPYYASSENHALGTYSMLVGCGATFKAGDGNAWNNGNPITFLQEGNVYVGMQVDTNGNPVNSGLAFDLLNGLSMTFDGDNIVVNGNITVSEHSTLGFTGKNVEVRGTITLQGDHSYLLLGEETNLVCKDIIIGGKSYDKANINSKADVAGYSLNFPYEDNNTSMNSNLRQNKVGSTIFAQDTAANRYYELKKGANGTFTYHDKTYKGTIYFDTAIVPETLVSVNYFDKNKGIQSTNVDAKFAELVNYAYLYHVYNVFDYELNCGSINFRYDKVNEVSLTNSSKDTLNCLPSGQTFYHASINGMPTQVYDGDKTLIKNMKYNGGTDYEIALQLGHFQNIVHGTKQISLVCSPNGYTVHFNNNDCYTGIFLSAEKVDYDVNSGRCSGRSIYNTSDENTETNMKNLKTFMDELGRYVLCRDYNGLEQQYLKQSYIGGYVNNTWHYEKLNALLINNLFNGGTSVFYRNKDEQNNSQDYSQNEDFDMIEFENWQKD